MVFFDFGRDVRGFKKARTLLTKMEKMKNPSLE